MLEIVKLRDFINYFRKQSLFFVKIIMLETVKLRDFINYFRKQSLFFVKIIMWETVKLRDFIKDFRTQSLFFVKIIMWETVKLRDFINYFRKKSLFIVIFFLCTTSLQWTTCWVRHNKSIPHHRFSLKTIPIPIFLFLSGFMKWVSSQRGFCCYELTPCSL